MEAIKTFDCSGTLVHLYPYEDDTATPANRQPRRVPGAGRFAVHGLRALARGEELELAAEVAGGGIAYIYAEVLLKDPEREHYYGPVLRQHVVAPAARAVRGVVRPAWAAPVAVDVSLRPALRLLGDGAGWAFCFGTPEGYGDPDLRVGGLYYPAGGAEPLKAALTLGLAGEVKQLIARKPQGRRSLPHPVVPREGDAFAPFVQTFTPSGEGWEVANLLSARLALGGRGMALSTQPLPAGDYLAGVVVEDLDGGPTRAYVPWRVP